MCICEWISAWVAKWSNWALILAGTVKRKILVLDLDETLIHSHHDGVLRPTVRPGTPPDFILKVNRGQNPFFHTDSHSHGNSHALHSCARARISNLLRLSLDTSTCTHTNTHEHTLAYDMHTDRSLSHTLRTLVQSYLQGKHTIQTLHISECTVSCAAHVHCKAGLFCTV